jgi:hypothetical protein
MLSSYSIERNSDPKKINSLRRVFEVSLLVLMIGILLTIHGALPVLYAPNLSVQSILIGEAKCIADNPRPWALCQHLGYPVGYDPLIMGYPATFFMAISHKLFSIPFIDGFQLLNGLCIVLGFFSFYKFLKDQTSSILGSSISVFAFYASVFMLGMKGFVTLYLGFLLFPLFVLGSVYLFNKFLFHLNPLKPSILIISVLIQFLLLGIAIMLDGYSYVMAMVVISIILIALAARTENQTRFKPYLFSIIVWMGLLILPGVLYKLFIFNEPSMFASSMEFLRGQSIDIATIFIPTRGYLLSKWLGIGPAAWNGYAFYGDGSNANYNFVGIFALLFTIIGVIIIFRDASKKRLLGIVGLLIFGVGFIFSIGPSLKVYDVRTEKDQAKVVYTDYLMPADAASLSLPTSILFKLPVISTMRAVYRWQLIFRFPMAFFIAIFLSFLFRKNVLIGVLVSVLFLVEIFPATAFTNLIMYTANREQEKLFTTNVVEKLAPYVKTRDRILFLPAANDYLLGLIIPFTGGETYNVFFDKEVTRIFPLQPEPIIAARTRYDDGSLTSTDVCQLINQDLVDAVIFNDFSMRWDSYSWPPMAETIQGFRSKIESLKLPKNQDLEITTLDFSTLVKPHHALPLNCK